MKAPALELARLVQRLKSVDDATFIEQLQRIEPSLIVSGEVNYKAISILLVDGLLDVDDRLNNTNTQLFKLIVELQELREKVEDES